MSAALVETRTVLNLAFWKKGIYLGDVGSSVKRLELTDEAFVDMGCPSYITVTVEPGDKLNGDLA